jgi:DNA-binding CsgD family transcriptional regulator
MTRILFITEDQSIYITEKPLPPEELAAEINAGTSRLDFSGLKLPKRTGHLVAFCYGDLVVLTWAEFPKVKTEEKENSAQGDCFHLTKRENQVLRDLIEGKTIKDISQAHGIKIRTVRSHVQALKYKYHVGTTEQLIARAAKLGIDRLSDEE